MADEADLPAALTRFIDLFNRQEFWESHEVLESSWRASGSRFYHGLILLASAFVHVQRDNTHGIAAQLRKAERALAPYPPEYLGIDVVTLRRSARELRDRAQAEEAPRGHRASWASRVTYPRLVIDPSRVRGDEPELAGG
ncbi:MAG: DUF309 domain-containing protein [Gemmatimonadota bacterium]|nr:DUF309 domain-containing protein [Gemmatimonadota bacterium]